MSHGRVLAMVLAVVLSLVPTSLHAGGQRLMTLSRVPGSYPQSVMRQLQRNSAVVPNYDDSGAWDGEWTVGLRYRNCATTRAGAIRLTVYRIPGLQNIPKEFLRRLPPGATQYARPVVDRKTSDTPMWQFDAAPKGTFYYKIDVLGRSCAYWGIAATTN